MSENKIDWTNFSFAQRYFKLEAGANIGGSMTPIGVGQLPPSVTPEALAAQLTNAARPIGRAREVIEGELLDEKDQPRADGDIKDMAYYIVRGISKFKKPGSNP
jgi:hypothetical protein